MPEIVRITKLNESYLKIDCDEGIAHELAERFTFFVPGCTWSPQFKAGFWDGKIRLFRMRERTIYAGLFEQVKTFCDEHGYDMEVDSSLLANSTFTRDDAVKFIESLKLPTKFEEREYQIKEFLECIKNKRLILLSPTGSGKSLLLYLLSRFYNTKTLVIEDRTSLVYQMAGDFQDYGFDKKNIHMIFSGQDKVSDKPVFISTWQSLYEMPKEWFRQFGLVLGDECHTFKAKSLTKIIENLINCEYRVGVSGTLDGSTVHELVLNGLFGPTKRGPTTRQLMDEGYLSSIRIKNLILEYTIEDRKKVRNFDYDAEIDFLTRHPKRNKFICNLALSLKGNTLVLYNFVERHGQPLYESIKEKAGKDRKVFFISGQVSGAERDQARSIIEKESNAIIVASLGTTSKGWNVKNLHNIIYAHPFKGQIITRQSIGRGLRVGSEKQWLTLFDIVDDLSYTNTNGSVKYNFALKHFLERIQIYSQEDFEFKNFNIGMK